MTFPGFKLVLAGQDVTDEDKVHHRANATLAVPALSALVSVAGRHPARLDS